MKPSELLVKCYASHEGECWQAFCLDFALAAQADTLPEAKAKLEEMIKEYVYDALIGEDKEYSEQLINRKAPLLEWLKFYWLVAKSRILNVKDGLQYFLEPLPLTPYDRHV